MLEDFGTELQEEDLEGSVPKTLTESQIQEFIRLQKAAIESRRVIQDILASITCQVFSASLALLLFKFAVDFVFVWALCSVLACLPTLPDLAQLRIIRTDDSWRIEAMNKPVLTLIRFGLGVVVCSSTIYGVANEIRNTEENIRQSYAEIKQYEYVKPKDFIPPGLGYVVIAASAITAICMIIKAFKRSPFE